MFKLYPNETTDSLDLYLIAVEQAPENARHQEQKPRRRSSREVVLFYSSTIYGEDHVLDVNEITQPRFSNSPANEEQLQATLVPYSVGARFLRVRSTPPRSFDPSKMRIIQPTTKRGLPQEHSCGTRRAREEEWRRISRRNRHRMVRTRAYRLQSLTSVSSYATSCCTFASTPLAGIASAFPHQWRRRFSIRPMTSIIIKVSTVRPKFRRLALWMRARVRRFAGPATPMVPSEAALAARCRPFRPRSASSPPHATDARQPCRRWHGCRRAGIGVPTIGARSLSVGAGKSTRPSQHVRRWGLPDALHDQGKMEWTKQPTPFGYPVFVVWKGDKPRAVVDMKSKMPWPRRTWP